jgi:hypothetical protein
MADEIASFAAAIGISPEKEPQLMDIAEEFYASPLPEVCVRLWSDNWKLSRGIKIRGGYSALTIPC